MNPTAELLSGLTKPLEAELRSRLQGFLGGMLRAYLPQAWVFRTEGGVATLLVDRDGRVSVVEAAAPQADVTVDAGLERLTVALRTRRREGLPPGAMTVTPHTGKGRTAFDYLRSRLGL
jgi:hypothetical protein